MSIISIKSVNKSYRGNILIHALSDVSIEVDSGQIVAVIGLNGAGKTTLTKIILSLISPDSGDILLFDETSKNSSWKIRVGYLPETFVLLPHYTPFSFLKFMSQLNEINSIESKKRIKSILEELDLIEHSNRKVETLSKGMLRKIGIAQAIIHNPQLLILDEPTDGLDPLGQKSVKNYLNSFKSTGGTVLINSHLLTEIETFVDKIVLLHKGKVLLDISITDMQNKFFKKFVTLSVEDYSKLNIHFTNISIKQDQIIFCSSNDNEFNNFINRLDNYGNVNYKIKHIPLKLSEVFEKYVQE
jgi:ABC-2 type transport system ATP-binding protein